MNEKKGIIILLSIVICAIITVSILDIFYDWIEIRNEYTIIVEIMVGAIIALIAIKRTDRDTKTITQLVTKINEYEEKQKEFLEELEKTRNARLGFYGTKLVQDFKKIKQCFLELETVPESELKKLDKDFFAKFKPAHVIETDFKNKKIEIMNLPFFLVMKEDLHIIEPDLPPEISFLVGKTIEMSQLCLNENIRIKDGLWNIVKQDIDIILDRFDSLIVNKKPLKEYGVHFYQFATGAKLNID